MHALDIKAIDISAHNEKQFAAKSASHDNDDNNGNAKANATSNRQKGVYLKHLLKQAFFLHLLLLLQKKIMFKIKLHYFVYF